MSISVSYTVTFNSNTGTGTQMTDQEISYNVSTNLTPNTYVKDGYIFNGWDTKADGSGTGYIDEAPMLNVGDITLYAQWILDSFNITYNLNDGTIATSNPDTYTSSTETFTLNNPVKTGYTFKGWSGTDLTGDENQTVTISKGSTGNREYTANWIPITYTIVFNANGGSGTMQNQTMTYDTISNLTANNFTRTGYTFTGWNTESNGSGTSYTNSQSVSNLTATNGATFNLYAQWKLQPTKYAVQIITHTVIDANGTETTSEAYLKDSGSNNVTRTAAQVSARENISLHEMSWTQIAAVNDKTVFEDCMLCGDTKSIELTLNSTIASGNIYNQYGDGAGMLYETVNTYYRIWNPSTNQNAAATNGGSNGANARSAGGYSTSHIRATLIGENTETDVTYAGNVNLTEDTCLFSCIESDLRNVITAKQVKYVTGTSNRNYDSDNTPLVDKIWLFSDREMYGTGQYSGYAIEGLDNSSVTNDTGVGYDKFGDTESKYHISSYNLNSNTNRVAHHEAGSTNHWWFRSLYLGDASYLRYARDGGNINSSLAKNDLGLAFGFCIQ